MIGAYRVQNGDTLGIRKVAQSRQVSAFPFSVGNATCKMEALTLLPPSVVPLNLALPYASQWALLALQPLGMQLQSRYLILDISQIDTCCRKHVSHIAYMFVLTAFC